MSLGPYASFIVTSYALVAAVVLLLIGWIAIDYRRQRQRLRELEASGVTRRSGRRRRIFDEHARHIERTAAPPALAGGAAADRFPRRSPRCSCCGCTAAIPRKSPPP